MRCTINVVRTFVCTCMCVYKGVYVCICIMYAYMWCVYVCVCVCVYLPIKIVVGFLEIDQQRDTALQPRHFVAHNRFKAAVFHGTAG